MAVDGTLSKVGKHGFALCGQTLCGGFCRILLPSVITDKVFGGHENFLCSLEREKEEYYKTVIVF